MTSRTPSISNDTKAGFTIVELLIVIVVIAILAAITIVSFNGIQSRAREASLIADVNYFIKAAEIKKQDTEAYSCGNCQDPRQVPPYYNVKIAPENLQFIGWDTPGPNHPFHSSEAKKRILYNTYGGGPDAFLKIYRWDSKRSVWVITTMSNSAGISEALYDPSS